MEREDINEELLIIADQYKMKWAALIFQKQK